MDLFKQLEIWRFKNSKPYKIESLNGCLHSVFRAIQFCYMFQAIGMKNKIATIGYILI